MNTTLKKQYDRLSKIQQDIFQLKAEIKSLKWGEKRLRKEIERIEKIPEEVREKLSDRYVKYVIDNYSSKLIKVYLVHMNELVSEKQSIYCEEERFFNKSATVINIMYDRNTKEIKVYYYNCNSGFSYVPSELVDITKEEFESYLPLNEQFIIYGD